MPEKVENGGDCGEDDDEWRDLIATPNRLISDDFFTLKSEKLEDREEDEGKEVVSSMEGRVRSSRVSIAERRAAMRGSDVNASRISVSVSSSRVTAWPPSVTIPSGTSPTSLLDSPIMLPNSQASPTTGSFQYPPLSQEISGMNFEVEDMSCDGSSFMYQNHGGSLIWPDQNVNDQPPLMYEFPKETVANEPPTELDPSQVFKVPKSIKSDNGAVKLQPSHTDDKDDTKRHQETSLSNMRNSEDGYNWRKYGQKQVKGSEYPRSYYKCTHPNCQVKKKVERSLDGHITEIIYKGAHNHQCHRNINGSPDANGCFNKIEDGEKWGNGNNIGIRPQWTSDRMNLSSSTSFADNNSDVKSGKFVGMYESAGNRDLSPSNPNHDCNEEDGNIGAHSPGDDADDDRSELKRRKKGNYLLETSLVTRAMREPRVVVQIESEVDILDDGYRWRKYGQKVVKGNPNPRSYYKCTSTGCPVRKHVERASDDLKSVLTTYEGKHNHEVPAARNSSHATVDAGPTTNTPTLPLSRINNIPKSEPQDLPLRFDRKVTNGYIPSNFVPNFETKPTKFEPSSMYQTEYMPYQNPIFNGSGLPDFPISLPMTMPPSGNMVHCFGLYNNGKRARDCEAQSFLGHGQHLRDNNGRFIKPKVEQDNGFYDTFMCAPDHVNDAASRFCRVIPNFPS